MIPATTIRPTVLTGIRADRLRWASRCLAALSGFQLVVAALLFLNRANFIHDMTGSSIAPTAQAARGTFFGTLGVHLVLAVVCAVLSRRLPEGRRATRLRATVICAATAIGGTLAAWLPADTSITFLGVLLAVATLVLMWAPTRGEARA